MTSRIWEPLTINKLQIKNRFVRSATMDNLGKDSKVTQAQLDMYRELARGEVGLIVSSGIYPTPAAQTSPGQLGAHCDEMIPSLKKIADTVHNNGGKIVIQLMHAGWFCRPQIIGRLPLGPSDAVNPFTGVQTHGLSSDEVWEEVNGFIRAGRRAIEAGFDGIQLHGAHSWFISSFLSPATNKRQDEWGGSAEKRGNLVLRIYEGLRKIAGPNYPLLIKVGLKDYHPDGKTLEEGIAFARRLEQAGMNAIEVSEGEEAENHHHIRLNAVSPYYLEECRRARQSLKLPLILVGGMRQLKDIEQVVDDGVADAISMCRPFVMDRQIVKKFREGKAIASGCTSCNGCIKEMGKGNIHCILNEC